MEYLYYFTIFLCLLFFFAKAKLKFVNAIILLFVLLMATSIYYGHDTESFMRSFEEYSTSKPMGVRVYLQEGSFLYVFLSWLSGTIGITYFFHFKLLLYSLVLFIILNGLKPFTANFYLVVFLYLIGPFISDSIQLRNTLSIGFLIPAIRYIIQGKDLYKAALLIMLASLNHATFIVFFFLFLLKLERKIYVDVCFWIGLGLFVMAFFFRNFSAFEVAQMVLQVGKYGTEVETETRLGPLVPFFYYIYVCGILYLMKKWSLVRRTNIIIEGDASVNRMVSVVFDIYRIMAIPLFTCVITISAWRFYRDIALYFIVTVVMFYFCKRIKSKRRNIVLLMSTSILYFYLWFTNYGQGRAEAIIDTVFNGDPTLLLGK